MKTNLLVLILITLVISGACSSREKSEGKAKYYSNKPTVSKNNRIDSIQLIDSCKNNRFISKLQENINLDSNAYILTITSNDRLNKIVRRLDLPPGKGHINYCNEDYTAVGFSCGGPCYSQVFVFTKEKKPNEQFDYCQRIPTHPNLIVHIENEKFEELIIHNFHNGKELTIDIPDTNFWNYGQMDTLFMIKNNLVLKYTTDDNLQKQKMVNLEKILN